MERFNWSAGYWRGAVTGVSWAVPLVLLVIVGAHVDATLAGRRFALILLPLLLTGGVVFLVLDLLNLRRL